MRVEVAAGSLATALGLAAGMVDSKLKIPALWHACLAADGGQLSITANVLDFALKLSLPATVETAGEIAIASGKLAALAGGFPREAEIAISADDKAAAISCGRSRFRLATLPIGDLPLMPAIDDKETTGCLELAREELLTLLSRPSFAISPEESRYYLGGIFVHDTDAGIAFTATDGHRLARVVLPGAGGLSQDRHLIIPRSAIKIILKLLADKDVERLTLRRSATLLEITSTKFAFVSKLIDGTFPSYERVLPSPSGNTATVDRAALAQAVSRVAAVTPDDKRLPIVGLDWKAPEPSLRLCAPGAPELADDAVDAETSGSGRIAVQIRHLAQLLDELAGDRVHIDAGGSTGSPVLIADPGDVDFTVVQMPCAWFEHEAAA
jgi:DNA polymerase-3 subunit beta